MSRDRTIKPDPNDPRPVPSPEPPRPRPGPGPDPAPETLSGIGAFRVRDLLVTVLPEMRYGSCDGKCTGGIHSCMGNTSCGSDTGCSDTCKGCTCGSNMSHGTDKMPGDGWHLREVRALLEYSVARLDVAEVARRSSPTSLADIEVLEDQLTLALEELRAAKKELRRGGGDKP